MTKIKRTSLVLTMFYLFSILFFVTMVQAEMLVKAQETIRNKTCPQIEKKLQVRIKGLKKVHKGMHNAISSSLPLDRIDRYNRHVNILEGNLGQEVKLIKGLLEKVQQRGRKCQEIAEGLSPHINKMYEIHTGVHAAIFNSNTSNYIKLVEKLGSQVNSISGEFDKQFARH
jgi:hypothetical protein